MTVELHFRLFCTFCCCGLKRFSGLFRFRFLPPSADRLPNRPQDLFGAAVSAVDLGVRRVR